MRIAGDSVIFNLRAIFPTSFARARPSVRMSRRCESSVPDSRSCILCVDKCGHGRRFLSTNGKKHNPRSQSSAHKRPSLRVYLCRRRRCHIDDVRLRVHNTA